MTIRATFTLIFTFLALSGVSACADSRSLPSRQQCIVQVVSLEPNETKFDTTGLTGLVNDAQSVEIPLAAIAVSGNQILYLQFRTDCGDRFAMAERVLLQRFSGDEFRIDHQNVMPGPRTINVFGESWSDGDLHWPPPVHSTKAGTAAAGSGSFPDAP